MLKTGYGLRDKKSKQLVGVSISSNVDGDCCGEFTHALSYNSEVPWIVKDKLTASYVRLFSTPWYNAEYETPVNNIDPNTMEVVKIEINVTKEDAIKLPLFEEYLVLKYNTPGKKSYSPEWYQMLITNIRNGKLYANYSISNIKELMEQTDD